VQRPRSSDVRPPEPSGQLDPRDAQACRAFLDERLAAIAQVVTTVCRRHRVRADETREILSAIVVKLIDNDYAVIRQFDGRSDFRTYMYSVVHRFLLDYRNSIWGKWRPSAEARRLGDIAVQLERLILRDGFTSSEGVQSVATSRDVGVDAIETVLDHLPLRLPARRAFECELRNTAASATLAQTAIDREELADEATRVSNALAAALSALAAEDRGLLRLRFAKRLPMSRIATLTRVDQKRLYRRFATILRRLRTELEARQVGRSELWALLGHPEVQVGAVLAGPAPALAVRTQGARATVTRLPVGTDWVPTAHRRPGTRTAMAGGR
jgi:RNA polymerase sigma factor (sigma-70 family)